MTFLEAVAVLLAGAAAGTINTVVGSGTLITFPTLLALGVPPVTANVSNTIGLVPGSVSGAIGYRRELEGQLPRLLRLGNNLLDGVIVNVVMFTMVLLVMLPPVIVNPEFDTEHTLLMACAYLIAFATSVAYYWLFELRWGRTPAKWATGTKVVRTDGGAPSSGQILGRSAARLIPFESLVIFFNADRLTLHDLVSGTRVVRAPR